MESFAVLEDGLHELVVVNAARPGDAVLEHPLGGLHGCLVPVVAVWEIGAARAVCDIPVLLPLLEDTTHHLAPARCRGIHRRSPVCTCCRRRAWGTGGVVRFLEPMLAEVR